MWIQLATHAVLDPLHLNMGSFVNYVTQLGGEGVSQCVTDRGEGVVHNVMSY